MLASYQLSNKFPIFDSFKELNSPYNPRKSETGYFQMIGHSSEQFELGIFESQLQATLLTLETVKSNKNKIKNETTQLSVLL